LIVPTNRPRHDRGHGFSGWSSPGRLTFAARGRRADERRWPQTGQGTGRRRADGPRQVRSFWPDGSDAFSNNDNGVHIFSYTFNALGFQTLTIADTSNSSISGTDTVDVLPQTGGGGPGAVLALDRPSRPHSYRAISRIFQAGSQGQEKSAITGAVIVDVVARTSGGGSGDGRGSDGP
jgi:hypothetical protein